MTPERKKQVEAAIELFRECCSDAICDDANEEDFEAEDKAYAALLAQIALVENDALESV